MRLIHLHLLLLFSVCGYGQQAADTLFTPPLNHPTYATGKGPLLVVDEAHHNFHTTTGRFRPFAEFLRRDGYVVRGFSQSFTKESLLPVKILVISNALHSSNEQTWVLPTPSAFTDHEIAALNQWVKEGGSLFLIADHMPFPGCNEKLAASFGITFYNGFARKKPNDGTDIFTLTSGLHSSPITTGLRTGEEITSLQTFTGQAFRIPSHAMPIVTLDARFELLLPKTAWVFDKDCEVQSAAGLVQGALLNYGKGRVVVFGEAAMFSAQTQGGSRKMGMNAPTATQNPQFLLNVIHWLDRLY